MIRIVAPALPLLLAVAPSWPAVLSAQTGRITYTHSVKIELPPEMARMREMVPSARETTLNLRFAPAASATEPEPLAPQGRGGAFRRGRGSDGDRMAAAAREMIAVGMADRAAGFERAAALAGGGSPIARMGPAKHTYANYETGEVVETREFMGRIFRIESQTTNPAWRMTSEQSTHLGHMVMKAVAERDGTKIEAWFAPQIAVSGGPVSYGGLPGMILVLSLDDGREQYFATDIELTEVDEKELGPPEDGQEVSLEEFEEIVEEKIEELRQTRRRGRGG